MSNTKTDRAWNPLFLGLLAVLSVGFICIEFLYIHTLPLVQDEFQQAHNSAMLLEQTPYLDFIPYKTVLGYYAQAAILLLKSSPTWDALLNIKLTMAYLNAALLFFGGILLYRLYSPFAVLAGLLFLLLNSTFLERSAEIRVDMLTAWAGWFSFIFLLRRQFLVSALLAGVSFLISQKGIYYCLAGMASFSVYQFAFHNARKALAQCFKYGLLITLPIAVYFIFWDIVSSFDTVFDSIFIRGTSIAADTSYDLTHFWWQTIRRNYIFYFLSSAGLSLLGASILLEKADKKEILLFVYLLVLTILCILHNQPWPYFFVILIPFLSVSITQLFETITGYRKQIAVILFVFSLLSSAPMAHLRVSKNLSRHNTIQKNTIEVAEQILSDDDYYFMGLNLLLTRNQIPAKELRWLDKRRISYLSTIAPETIVGWIRNSRAKIIIDNYRLHKLPPRIVEYLSDNYLPYCSNIFIYAPILTSDNNSNPPELLFGGIYQVVTKSDNSSINNQDINVGDRLELTAGKLHVTGHVRLRMEVAHAIPSTGGKCQSGPFFPSVYTY